MDVVESCVMAVTPTFDPSRQSLAKAYARTRRALALGEMILGGMYLGLWNIAPWAIQVRDTWAGLADRWRVPSGPTEAIVLLGVALSLVAPWWILTLPLDVYASYRLPHRYGLSNQTSRDWVIDRVKGLIVGAGLGIPLLLALYGLMGSVERWWLWASVGYAAVTIVLITLGPIVLLPLFNKLRPLGESHQELRDRLTRLAERAGVHVRSVDTIDLSRRTKAANAMLVGLGRTRRIALGDTLLESFDDDETETVLAHELGHHAQRDIPAGILLQTVAVVVVFGLLDVVLHALVRAGRLESLADPAGWPAFVLAWSLLTFLESPLLLAYSRWREARADEFAVRLSGKPEAFIRAMVRLGDQNLAEAEPPPWAVVLFASHPSLRRRVEAARQPPLARSVEEA